jgi:glycosyltransferase involved in cell wall biosynthesis
MKVLFLVQSSQRSILDTFYQAIIDGVDECELLRVNADDQKDLKKYFATNNIEAESYDRVILFLRYKKMMRQIPFIRTLPNLVIIELDAFQNYCESKYNGKFSAYFGKIPWVRIMCTGQGPTLKLQAEGFDACFIAKAYDHKLLKNINIDRDIELAFIGSLQSDLYQYRKDILEELATRETLHIERTDSGEDYLNILNRVKFFVSADIDFSEYMIKNFEAMACGCLLFTWDNGEVENKAMGLIDMENVVLYKTVDELQEKLHFLRENEALATKIAKNGQRLVEQNHTWEHAASRLVTHLQPPLRQPRVEKTWFGLLKKFTFAPPVSSLTG